MLTQAEFDALARQGFNRIPVILSLFADLDTPLSVYLKLANQPYSYLLESVVGGERFGRYSFIGRRPPPACASTACACRWRHGDRVVETHEGDPLGFIEAFRRASPRRRTTACRALPGGLVNFLVTKPSS